MLRWKLTQEMSSTAPRRPRHQFRHPAIECREPSMISCGERKQVGIRHLPIADDPLEGRRIRIHRRYIISPELVSRKPANLSQKLDRLPRRPHRASRQPRLPLDYSHGPDT